MLNGNCDISSELTTVCGLAMRFQQSLMTLIKLNYMLTANRRTFSPYTSNRVENKLFLKQRWRYRF